MAGRPQVRLNPNVQRRILEQMREERTSVARSRAIRRYVVLPVTFAIVVGSIAMAFSEDTTTAMVGNLLGSGLLWGLWKIRKQFGYAFGLG